MALLWRWGCCFQVHQATRQTHKHTWDYVTCRDIERRLRKAGKQRFTNAGTTNGRQSELKDFVLGSNSFKVKKKKKKKQQIFRPFPSGRAQSARLHFARSDHKQRQ